MTTVSVTIGHNIRRWVTFTVENPTPEELDILRNEDDVAIALLDQMDMAGRLEFASSDDEVQSEDANPFDEHRNPAIVDYEEVDE